MVREVVQTDADRYVIVEYLAEGGMGAIFLGKKVGLEGFEKEVVLKQLLPEFTSQPEFIDLFLREAKLSATLDHANIVHTIDLVAASDDFFIVLEYVRGGDLRTILRRIKTRGQVLLPAAALFVAREILSALSYAHEKNNPDGTPLNLIHRDISPSNIMISGSGEVKLTDFGIAKVSTHKSVFYRVKGKVGYMSPEQAFGDKPLDLRSDLYSLSVCLYEMLAGERLFVADLLSTPEQIYGQVLPALEGLPNMPTGLDRVLGKSLAIDPDDRYQTALEMQDALVQVAFESGMIFTPPDLSNELRKVCGPDPSTWNQEEEEEDTGEEHDGPGTEVLNDDSDQFSKVELTSIFTGLPEALGPAPTSDDFIRNQPPPAREEATRHLRRRRIAFEPTQLAPEDLPSEELFDFSDRDHSFPGSEPPGHPVSPERWDLDDSDLDEPTVDFRGAPEDRQLHAFGEPRGQEYAEPLEDPYYAPSVEDASVPSELSSPRLEDASVIVDQVHHQGEVADPMVQVHTRELIKRREISVEIVPEPAPAPAGLEDAEATVEVQVHEEEQALRHVPLDDLHGSDPDPILMGMSPGMTETEAVARRPRQHLLVFIAVGLLLLSGVAIAILVALTGPDLDQPISPRAANRKEEPPETIPLTQRDATPTAAGKDAGADAARVSSGSRVVHVHSSPPRARVFIDDYYQCTSPCTISSINQDRVYLLSVRRKRYVSWSSLVDMRGKQSMKVEAYLSEEPDVDKVGYLLISSKPRADVYVDGKEIGRVTSEGRIPLPPGQYEIMLSHPRKKARPKLTVKIYSGQTVAKWPVF